MEDHLKSTNTAETHNADFSARLECSMPTMAESLTAPYKTLNDIDKRRINEVVALMEVDGAGSKRAWVLMFNTMRGRIIGALKRRGVGIDDADELMGDVIYKFIWCTPQQQRDASALALLKSIVEGVAVDWYRKNNAKMRGGEIQFSAYDETEGDDDEPKQPVIYKGTEVFAASIEMTDCISRTFDFFTDQHPDLAHPLVLYVEGLSNREIASLQLAIPEKEISTKQENAAKSRVYWAIRQAKEFFKYCKE